jgi:hypothetical protein
LVYHLIIAVVGIVLLFCGWLWLQGWATREECEGLADEAACVVGPGCGACARAGDAKARPVNRRPSDSLFPGERPPPDEGA